MPLPACLTLCTSPTRLETHLLHWRPVPRTRTGCGPDSCAFCPSPGSARVSPVLPVSCVQLPPHWGRLLRHTTLGLSVPEASPSKGRGDWSNPHRPKMVGVWARAAPLLRSSPSARQIFFLRSSRALPSRSPQPEQPENTCSLSALSNPNFLQLPSLQPTQSPAPSLFQLLTWFCLLLFACLLWLCVWTLNTIPLHLKEAGRISLFTSHGMFERKKVTQPWMERGQGLHTTED